MTPDAKIRKEQGKRLQEARVAAGYRSARAAALANGWPESSYAAHENGSRTIGRDDAERYARRFRASGAHVSAKKILFSEEGDTAGEPYSLRIPVVGRIGPGATIEPRSDGIPVGGLFEILLPFPVSEGVVGLEVDGESMLPKYEPGDIVIVWKEQRRNTNAYLGHLAAVQTVDGRRFLRTIVPGSRSGLYRLESFNARPIDDVQIEWIGEINVIVPAEQVRHPSVPPPAAARPKNHRRPRSGPAKPSSNQ